MEKSSALTANEPLPEFQKFLRDKKLAPEKNVFFIALWASKFFSIFQLCPKKADILRVLSGKRHQRIFRSTQIRSPSRRLANQTGKRCNQALLFSFPGAQTPPFTGRKGGRHCTRRPAQGDNAAIAAQALFLQYGKDLPAVDKAVP